MKTPHENHTSELMSHIHQDRKDRFSALIKGLSTGMFERDEVMKLSFLAMMAGESVFLLGPPGTAKSLTARRLKSAFLDEDIKSFEYLMGRFSTPDELFGPISVQGLKQDRYERNTQGYLPSAHIVFLDELWKASPAIQNSLLTVVNERVYRNGRQEEPVSMRLLVAASNELPMRGVGLEALWDRFLVRLWVDNIKDMNLFKALLTSSTDVYSDPLSQDQAALKLSLEEYDAMRAEIAQVSLGQSALELLISVKKAIHHHNEQVLDQEGDELTGSDTEQSSPLIYVSDRRWKKITHLLRASAYCNGRDSVDRLDVGLVAHCIWDEEEHIKVAEELVAKALEMSALTPEETRKQIYRLEALVDKLNRDLDQEKSRGSLHPHLQQHFDHELTDCMDELKRIRADISGLRASYRDQNLFISEVNLKALSCHESALEQQLDRLEKTIEELKGDDQ